MMSDTSGKGGRIRAPWFVWALTAAFILLCTLWSVMTPSLRSPDEPAHFSTVVRIADGFEWPDPGDARIPNAVVAAATEGSQPQFERSTLRELIAQHPGDSADDIDQMTQHPPVYYMLVSSVLLIPGVQDLPWGIALILLRMTGGLFAAPLVWIAWRAALELTRSRRVAAVAAVTPFIVPQFAQTYGALNNDTAVITLIWGVSLIAVRVLGGDRRPWLLVAFGSVFGLAALTKGTALPLGFLLVASVLLAAGSPGPRRRVVDLALTLAPAAIIGGWWWLRNIVLFRSIQPSGLPQPEQSPWAAGTGPGVGEYIDTIWTTTFTTFWGNFGRIQAPLPEPLVETLTIGCVLFVVAGIVAVVLHERRWLRTVIAFLIPTAVTLALFLSTSWSAYEDFGRPRGLHGRYFYTLLLLVILLSVISAQVVVRHPSSRRAAAFVVVAGAGLLVVTGLSVALTGFYADHSIFQLASAAREWLRLFEGGEWLVVLPLVLCAAAVVAGLLGVLRSAMSSSRALVIPTNDVDA